MNWKVVFLLLVVVFPSILMTVTAQAGRPETGNTPKAAYRIDLDQSLSVTVGERTEVWFRYRGTAGGLVQVSTCPTQYDTVVGAYTGSPVSPAFIWSADDGDTCQYAANAMRTFLPEKGKAYYFKVTQLGGGSPPAGTTLTFSISAVVGGLP